MQNKGRYNDLTSSRLLYYFFPFRDCLGINAGSTPLRIGELYSVIYSIYVLIREKKCTYIPQIDNNLFYIIILLATNVLLVAIVSFLSYDSIDTMFMVKYVIRNVLVVVLIAAIWKTSISYSNKLILAGIKWNIVLQIIAAFIFFGLGQRVFMNHMTSIWEIQTASYGGVELPRYSGTASEAGYLGPLLAMPLYYFIAIHKSKINKYLLVLCVTLLIVSLSSFNYLVIILGFVVFNYQKNKIKTLLWIIMLCILGAASLSIIITVLNNTVIGSLVETNINKMLGYVTFGTLGEMDWSANDRNDHLINAYRFFCSGNIFEILFGHGTGAYSYTAAHHSMVLVDNVEEAYNLYLSTLTDRGVCGLMIYASIYYYIFKIKTKNVISNSIWFAICIQLIHYMLVGNMWLYYVWQEVVFLIGYERYRFMKRHKKIIVYDAQNNYSIFTVHKFRS